MRDTTYQRIVQRRCRLRFTVTWTTVVRVCFLWAISASRSAFFHNRSHKEGPCPNPCSGRPSQHVSDSVVTASPPPPRHSHREGTSQACPRARMVPPPHAPKAGSQRIETYVPCVAQRSLLLLYPCCTVPSAQPQRRHQSSLHPPPQWCPSQPRLPPRRIPRQLMQQPKQQPKLRKLQPRQQAQHQSLQQGKVSRHTGGFALASLGDGFQPL
jgi:hypothetical protein